MRQVGSQITNHLLESRRIIRFDRGLIHVREQVLQVEQSLQYLFCRDFSSCSMAYGILEFQRFGSMQAASRIDRFARHAVDTLPGTAYFRYTDFR